MKRYTELQFHIIFLIGYWKIKIKSMVKKILRDFLELFIGLFIGFIIAIIGTLCFLTWKIFTLKNKIL